MDRLKMEGRLLTPDEKEDWGVIEEPDEVLVPDEIEIEVPA